MDELEAELARVAERDGVVKAWVARHDPDRLRVAAAALPHGRLAGWTLGVKDVIDTADLPTERGSAIYAGRRPRHDAACVAMARRAGALVTGKTATTEFALFTPTVTTNPHDPKRTPGGSSSGSAAAVADGMVRAAFGTQTVGSVIRPAAFCGVVGFKPTRGLVPLDGVAGLASSFDTVGWMTRSVADTAALFTALTDDGAISLPGPGSVPAAGEPLRIGLYRSHLWPAAQPELVEILDNAVARLADGTGGGIELVDIDPLPHLDGFFEAADTVLHYEVCRVLAWERAHDPEAISPLVRKMLARADGVDHGAYTDSQLVLAAARRAHQDFLGRERLDALLTPSAPGEAPPLKTTGDSVFNRTWTSLGVPAVQLPAGVGPHGLPVGVQLTGASWADPALLGVAARAEAALTAPH